MFNVLLTYSLFGERKEMFNFFDASVHPNYLVKATCYSFLYNYGTVFAIIIYGRQGKFHGKSKIHLY